METKYERLQSFITFFSEQNASLWSFYTKDILHPTLVLQIFASSVWDWWCFCFHRLVRRPDLVSNIRLVLTNINCLSPKLSATVYCLWDRYPNEIGTTFWISNCWIRGSFSSLITANLMFSPKTESLIKNFLFWYILSFNLCVFGRLWIVFVQLRCCGNWSLMSSDNLLTLC